VPEHRKKPPLDVGLPTVNDGEERHGAPLS
jgi:hypothetical protein